MHKTVAQLIDLLAPPPVAPIVKTPAKKAREPKPPKEPRPPKEPKPKTPRASKKRAGENGAPDGEGTGPKKRRKKKDSVVPVAAAGGASATVNGEVHAHSILNLPPGEAARRRETTIKLLSESNIDPETLSAEQFNIFANQSPELQQDSLTMLMRYGAERLRIVHPNKDAPSSG